MQAIRVRNRERVINGNIADSNALTVIPGNRRHGHGDNRDIFNANAALVEKIWLINAPVVQLWRFV